MRIYALVLTLFVLRAHSASINNKPEKRSDDLDNVELDDVSDLDSFTPAKLDSNVDKIISDIPVAVVEAQAVKKLDENSNDYVPEDDTSANIKRLDVDLENPGEPQRQEHETQNPDSFSELDKAVEAVKLRIEETKNVFNEELKVVAKSLQNIFTANEDLPRAQENIQNLKTAFANKFQDLSNAIKPLIQPNGAYTRSALAGSNSNVNIIESRLKSVEQSFEHGVNTLSEGVELLAIIREEDAIEKAKEEAEKAKNEAGKESETAKEVQIAKNEETDTAAATSGEASAAAAAVSPATPAPTATTVSPAISNPSYPFIQGFQTAIANAFNSLSLSFQGQSNQNNATTTATNTTSPGGIGGFFQNFNFFGNQGTAVQATQVQQNQTPGNTQADEAAPSRPSVVEVVQGAWQNFVNGQAQFGQGLAQYFRPQNTAEQSATQTQGGTNATLQRNPAQQQPAISQPPSPGPIQNIIQNNPIVKGIQMAVQRLQNNTSADTPRKPAEIKKENTKGLVGDKGHPGGDHNGDIIVSNVDVAAEEPEKVEAASDIVHESVQEEALQPEVPEKTE